MPVLDKAEQNIAAKAAARRAPSLITEERGLLSRFSGFLGPISTIVAFAPMLGGLLAWAAKKGPMQKIAGPLNAVSKVANLPNSTIGELSGEVGKVFGENHVLSTAAKATHSRVADFANKTLSSGIRERLSNVTATGAVIAGTQIIGEGANMVATRKMQIQSLKRMQKAITGVEPSTNDIKKGRNLDPMVMQARQEMYGKKAFWGKALQTGGMLGNLGMMLFSRNTGMMSYFLKTTAISMGTSMAASALTSGDTALAAFNNMDKSFQQAGRASLADYIGVVGGFSKGVSDQKVQAFAKQCYEERLEPGEVMRRISVFQKASTGKLAGMSAGSMPQAPIGAATAREAARRAVSGTARNAYAI